MKQDDMREAMLALEKAKGRYRMYTICLLYTSMPPEVSEYIANKLKSNIRQLEGVVKKLKAYKLLVGSPTTILIAQNAILSLIHI